MTFITVQYNDSFSSGKVFSEPCYIFEEGDSGTDCSDDVAIDTIEDCALAADYLYAHRSVQEVEEKVNSAMFPPGCFVNATCTTSDCQTYFNPGAGTLGSLYKPLCWEDTTETTSKRALSCIKIGTHTQNLISFILWEFEKD